MDTNRKTQFNYARDLVYSLDYLLHGWCCPSYLRPFIQKILILAPDIQTPVSDAEFSMLLGRSRHNMTALRRRLEQWQREVNSSVVEVFENTYDARLKKHKPTEYKFAALDLLLRIVSEARESSRYEHDWKRAIRAAAKRLSSETETAPLWRHRPARRVRSHEDEAKTLFKLFGTITHRNLEHARRGGQHPQFMVAVLQNKVELVFDEMIIKEPARVKGKYAHLPTSGDDFARRKAEDIEDEDRRRE
jgi:hypothetical protein